jgi:hypothetical protein
MASDLRYQFLENIRDEGDDKQHVTIRLYVARDQTNTVCDVSIEAVLLER